jgi:hypothetical protein
MNYILMFINTSIIGLCILSLDFSHCLWVVELRTTAEEAPEIKTGVFFCDSFSRAVVHCHDKNFNTIVVTGNNNY